MKNTTIENLSIDDPVFKKFAKVYEYALEKTKNELDQAVEGMYHNLNTLKFGALI